MIQKIIFSFIYDCNYVYQQNSDKGITFVTALPTLIENIKYPTPLR